MTSRGHHITADTSTYRARLGRLRAALRREGVDHVLVSDPRDVGYLTGFLGGDSFLLVGPGKPLLLSDTRYEEELGAFAAIATPVMRDGPMSGLVARLVAERSAAGRLERVAVQAEAVSLAQFDGLRAAFKKAKAPVKALTSVRGVLAGLRMVKDEHEVGLIRRAAKIQQDALAAVLPAIKPGMTEAAIAALLEHEMLNRGSGGRAFETIVAAGANGSKPHYRPGPAKLRAGSTLLIDFGATCGGYHSDMTRTFALGRWKGEMAEVYRVVLGAHEAAAAALRAGARCVDVDGVARAHIAEHGYGERFGHGLGHGIGLNIHEGPSMGKHSGDAVLEAGHVVTIEPGVYLPGLGGVRIEDDYLVTARGAKNLCSLPRDAAWAIL